MGIPRWLRDGIVKKKGGPDRAEPAKGSVGPSWAWRQFRSHDRRGNNWICWIRGQHDQQKGRERTRIGHGPEPGAVNCVKSRVHGAEHRAEHLPI